MSQNLKDMPYARQVLAQLERNHWEEHVDAGSWGMRVFTHPSRVGVVFQFGREAPAGIRVMWSTGFDDLRVATATSNRPLASGGSSRWL
jgi:hypothetical protein